MYLKMQLFTLLIVEVTRSNKFFKPWNKPETIEQIVVPIQLVEPLHKNTNPIMTHEAERFNGWAAMLGFVAAIGAYVSTGQIIPGIF